MTSRAHRAIIGMAAVIGLGGGIYLGLSLLPGNDGIKPEALAQLYATSLPDLANHQQAVSQWKNKTIVVNFWATWCAPCREEIPGLIRVQRRYMSKDLVIVGIAVDSADNAGEFAKSMGINYPVLVGGLDAINLSRSLGNHRGALPYTVVVSPGGTAIRPHLGKLSESELDALIAETRQSAEL